jgi:hypothetical protein
MVDVVGGGRSQPLPALVRGVVVVLAPFVGKYPYASV